MFWYQKGGFSMEQMFGYKIIKILGKGKTGTAYLAEKTDSLPDKKYVLKVLNKDVSDYNKQVEIFSGEKYAYQRMSKIGRGVPVLHEFNSNDNYLVKEYVDGICASELAATGYGKKGGLEDWHFEKMFDMNKRFMDVGIHVDYFPSNFIFTSDKELYCIDYECYDYNAEWDFINWGIYYWLNQKGIEELLKNGETSKLNIPGTPKPFTEEFEDLKRELMKKFLI